MKKKALYPNRWRSALQRLHNTVAFRLTGAINEPESTYRTALAVDYGGLKNYPGFWVFRCLAKTSG